MGFNLADALRKAFLPTAMSAAKRKIEFDAPKNIGMTPENMTERKTIEVTETARGTNLFNVEVLSYEVPLQAQHNHGREARDVFVTPQRKHDGMLLNEGTPQEVMAVLRGVIRRGEMADLAAFLAPNVVPIQNYRPS